MCGMFNSHVDYMHPTQEPNHILQVLIHPKGTWQGMFFELHQSSQVPTPRTLCFNESTLARLNQVNPAAKEILTSSW